MTFHTRGKVTLTSYMRFLRRSVSVYRDDDSSIGPPCGGHEGQIEWIIRRCNCMEASLTASCGLQYQATTLDPHYCSIYGRMKRLQVLALLRDPVDNNMYPTLVNVHRLSPSLATGGHSLAATMLNSVTIPLRTWRKLY